MNKTTLRSLKSEIALQLNLPLLYSRNSYSQEGEDLILAKIFNAKNKGFYVDVGAHHPYRYSNTYLLHKKGWTGINIDPNPNTKKIFDNARPNDTNLQLAIAKSNSNKTLYIFEDFALNTLNKTQAQKVIKSGQSILIKKTKINTKKLSEILNKNSKNQIDLLNIDAEGLEMEVLNSNNWQKFKPKVIVIENLNSAKKINSYLKKLGYKKIAQTVNTAIYQND